MIDLIRRARIVAKQIVGVEPHVRTRRPGPLEFHGNDQGGWCIARDSLGPGAVVIDIGLGEDISFSESIIAKYGCPVLGFDPTPRAIEYVSRRRPSGFALHEYGIGAHSGPVHFYLPKRSEHVSGAIAREEHLADAPIEVQLKTISEIFKAAGGARIDLLKLDVEGAEYDVIAGDEFTAVAPHIGQLCVEFHHRWRTRGKESTVAAVDRLAQLGFTCIWKSATTNEEFTFARMDRVGGVAPRSSTATVRS